MGKREEALTDTGESHERGSGLCGSNTEITFFNLQTTSQEGAPQNEEQVGENGTKQLRKRNIAMSLEVTSPE